MSGIFDGMGLAHILGNGAEELSGIGDRSPLLGGERVVAFGYQEAWMDDAERALLASTGMLEFPRSQIESQPWRAAEAAVTELGSRVKRLVVHFDVDVVDHPDLPVADVAHFGGLSLDDADRCLTAFLSSPAVGALVLTEFNALQDPEGSIAHDLALRITRAIASGSGRVPRPRSQAASAALRRRAEAQRRFDLQGAPEPLPTRIEHRETADSASNDQSTEREAWDG
jgi:arginase